MKKIFLSLVLTLAATSAFAAPMNMVEKTSYRLTSMIQSGEIPASMSTHMQYLKVETGTVADGSNGVQITVFAASNNSADSNSVTLQFSQKGKVVKSDTRIVGTPNSAPIFADGAKLLDLAAEAVVDHLAEDPALVDVAEKVQSIEVSNQNGPLFQILLNDGRVFKIFMDNSGTVISKGF